MSNQQQTKGGRRSMVRTVVVRISRKLRATYRIHLGRRYSALLLAMLSLMAPAARALPQGGTVTAGQATVSTPTANSMVVNQTTQRAALDWTSFNIGRGESVQFVQPGANAVALNRVVGTNASAIYGSLSANGQVFLINPMGVMFAPGAQVNVGGLVATTLSLSNADFMAGRYQFSGSGGSVVNEGTINGGYVVLAAPSVTNAGTVSTPGGTTALLAGSRVTVDPRGEGLVNFSVDAAAVSAAIANSGTIAADGGHVALTAKAASDALSTVINQTGVIRANSISNQNGTIVLSGGATGVVKVSGTLEARGDNAGESGGTVKVLGDKVALRSSSQISASGDAGGGTVLVGGNWQGKGSEQNASSTFMATGANISADAVNTGDGGTVVVWADGSTAVGGAISARGGAQGGRGGKVETSGKESLVVASSTTVDTSTPQGSVGIWLLDPKNITVANGGAAALGDVDQFTDTPASNVTIAPATLNGAADVSLLANNDITFVNPLLLNGWNFSAKAGRSIIVNSNIAFSSYGNFSLDANYGGGNPSYRDPGLGSLTIAPGVSLPNGTIFLTVGTGFGPGTGGALTINGTLTNSGVFLTNNQANIVLNGTITASSQFSLQAGTNVSQVGGTISAGSLQGYVVGSTSLGQAGNAIGSLASFTSSGGLTLVDGSGGLTVSGAVNAGSGTASITTTGGVLDLNSSVSGANVTLTATGNNISLDGAVTTAGALTLNAGGSISQTAALNVGSLAGSAGTTAILSNASNKVGALNGFSTGSGFVLADSTGGLAVNGAVAGGTGGANISTTGGVLDVNATVTGANVALASTNNAITLDAGVTTAGTMTLNAGTSISQTAALSAGTLTGNATTGTATLAHAGNTVGNLNAFTTGTGFTLVETGGGLNVNGAVNGGTGTASITTSGGILDVNSTVTGANVLLASTNNDIRLDGAVTTAGTLTLNAGGSIGQNAALSVGTLTGSAGTTASLTLGGNAIGNLGAFSVGDTFMLVDGGGGLNVNGAITGGTGTLRITTAGGTLDVNAPVSGNDVTLATDGAISLDGAVTTPYQLTLDAGTDITQSVAMNVRVLTGHAPTGSVTLNAAGNAVDLLNFFSTGNGFTLTDGSGGLVVNIGGVTGGTGTVSLTTTGGALDVGAPVSGANVTLASTDGAVRLDAGVTTAGTLTLNAGTGITQTTALSAGTLTGTATAGSAILANAGNAVDTLGSFTTGTGLTLVDGSGGLNVNGTVTGGTGTVAITTAGGALALGANNVSGAGVALTGVGVTQSAASTVNASAGDILVDANDGSISLAGALTTTSNSATAVQIIDATSTALGNITTGATGTVRLGTAGPDSLNGAVTQNAGTAINTGTLTVAAATTVDLGNSNTATKLGPSISSGGFTFNDAAGGLTLAGNVMDASGTVAITTAGGTLALGANNVTGAGVSLTGVGVTQSAASTVNAGTGNILVDANDGTINLAGALTTSSNSATAVQILDGSTAALGNITTGATGTTTIGGAGANNISGAVTQTAATAINTGTLTVNGGSSVTLADANTVSSLAAVTTNGDFTLTSTSALDVTGPVNSGSGGVTLQTTAGALEIAAAGDITAGGPVSLSGAGGINTAGDVATTNASVTFDGAATLSGPVTVNSGSGAITFASTVDGNAALTANSTGTTTFAGAVGSGSALASLTTGPGGTTAINGGTVTTTGAQNYNDAVTLGANTTLASTSGGDITLGGAVDGAQSLVVNTTGTATFGGAVGGTTALTSLTTNAGGTTAINGGAVTTTGAQTYNDAVTLGADTTLTSTGSGNISFADTVNGAQSLVVTAGMTTFGGAVGNTTALASVTMAGGGATAINGGSIATAGAQSYGGSVTLGAATTLTGTDVTFADMVTGPHALTVNASGTTAFNTFNFVDIASLTTDAGGTTVINTNTVHTSGAQIYNDAVMLATTSGLTSTGSNITFASTVNGAHGLIVNTAAGTATFGGAVGGTTALTSLTTGMGGTTAINGGTVTTTGAQTYNNAVTLGAATTLASTGSGDIAFASTVNGAQTLAVNTAGTTTFGAAVGGATAPTSLTTDAGGTTHIGANITTVGAQTFGDDVVLTGNATLASTGTGTIDVAGGLTGNYDLAVTTAGSARVGGAATVGSLDVNADAGINLGGNVTTSGAQVYRDAVASSANSLTLDAGGPLTLQAALNAPSATSVTLQTAGVLASQGALIISNSGDLTLSSGANMTVDAAQLSPVNHLIVSSTNGDILFNNTQQANGGGGVFASQGITVTKATQASFNLADNLFLAHQGTPSILVNTPPNSFIFVNVSAEPAPVTPVSPVATATPALHVSGIASELNRSERQFMREKTSVGAVQSLVRQGNASLAAVTAPLGFKSLQIRQPDCLEAQHNQEGACAAPRR